ncbi:MAG: iron-containing alcohol dehydrogenase, partial [bacterium]|nr:iron-containing alcohol dehydrogenase [bacterium]
MPLDNLRITAVESRRDLKKFIKLPYQLYRSDPHWIPPLFFERRDLIDPKKNPYFEHAQVQLFLASRNGKTIGRISAQLDQEYEKFHGERLGHFGFLEVEENPETASALIQAAEEYLKALGISRMVGPFNYSINQESGLLIDGFDQPLMIMTPYNPPFYATFLENMGLKKVKDIFAWHFPVGPVPSDPQEIANEVKKQDGVSIRSVDLKNFHQDFKTMIDVFNSAWSKNWGYVPWTDKEIKTVAKEMKIILDPEVTLSQPLAVTALTGIDALSHAMESFVTTKRNTLAQMFAIEGWKLL